MQFFLLCYPMSFLTLRGTKLSTYFPGMTGKKLTRFAGGDEEYTGESTKEDNPQVNEEIMPKISSLWCSELASARVLVMRNFSLHICFLSPCKTKRVLR